MNPRLRVTLALACLSPVAAASVGCGSTEEVEIAPVDDGPGVEEPLAASPGSVVLDVAPPPAHDGTVVMVEGIPVEVVAHSSGQVYAWMLGEEVPAEDRVELTVTVPTEQRASGRPVRMRFEGGRWVGRVRRLEIVPGPVDVLVVLDDEELRGHVDVIVIAPALDVNVEVVEVSRPAQVIEVRRGKHKHRRRGKHRRGRGRGIDIRIH